MSVERHAIIVLEVKIQAAGHTAIPYHRVLLGSETLASIVVYDKNL